MDKQEEAVIQLQNQYLRLSIDSSIGATVTELSYFHKGSWLELMRKSPVPLERSSDGGFIMAPWSNRIRDGRFSWNDEIYSLKYPEKHSRHGDVRERKWRIEAKSENDIVLALESDSFADFNFPFPIELRIDYRLSENSFSTSLSITNRSQQDIPLGAGFHPYFRRSLLENDVEEVELQFNVGGEYPYSGELPLPEGPPVKPPQERDFSELKPLVEGIDHCFSSWSGRAQMRWPQSRVAAEMISSETARHLILYSPPGSKYFALEPATMATDGFNLLAQGQSDTGVAVTAPGEEFLADYRLRIEAY